MASKPMTFGLISHKEMQRYVIVYSTQTRTYEIEARALNIDHMRLKVIQKYSDHNQIGIWKRDSNGNKTLVGTMWYPNCEKPHWLSNWGTDISYVDTKTGRLY